MPGSPTRRTTRPRPAARSSTTARSCPSSGSLPTIGVVGAAASRSFARTRVDAVTGFSLPFTAISPNGSRTKRSASRRAVCSPTTIDPGSAAACSRAATFVASPSATICGSAVPTSPTAAGPLLTPTLTAKPEIPHARSMSSRITADDLVDAERGPGGALGIVLMSGGDAEVGADAVPLVGLHRAAVLLDGPAHHRHALADEHLDLVGRESLAEHRRADDVGEEDGHRSSLVLPRLGAQPGRSPPAAPASRDDRGTRPGAGSTARAPGAPGSAPARAPRSAISSRLR